MANPVMHEICSPKAPPTVNVSQHEIYIAALTAQLRATEANAQANQVRQHIDFATVAREVEGRRNRQMDALRVEHQQLHQIQAQELQALTLQGHTERSDLENHVQWMLTNAEHVQNDSLKDRSTLEAACKTQAEV